jgi:hypothetical protein
MTKALGVDSSVAILALTENGGDIEKASDSLVRAIQAERVREETPQGTHSQTLGSAKPGDNVLQASGPSPFVATSCVPRDTVSVRGGGGKPIHGNPGSASDADGACGSASKSTVSNATSETATKQDHGGVQGTGHGRGRRGKGKEDGSGKGGNVDLRSAG